MTKILILYHSQEYGNTGKMAQAVAEGAREGGAEVTLFNTNDARFDVEEYRTYDAVAFGTPDYYSYIAGMLKTFLDDWYLAKKTHPRGMTGKPIALFYSHGGGGAVRRPLEALFGKLGTPVAATVASEGAPSPAEVAACREVGRALARAVG